jgi:hypothetical protein
MNRVHVSELPPELLRRQSVPRKIRLATEILRVYCRARWALLRSSGFNAAVAALRAGGSEDRLAGESASTFLQAARLGWAVRRTLRLLPTDSRCLMQSLVLTQLLARRGIDSSLVIGVRAGDDFEAHAWVEYCGEPLLPGSQGTYQPLTRV